MEKKYEVVINALLKEMQDGAYSVDAKLPTELALMSQFQVSRHTVRKALADLEGRGYVYRIQGGGSYVADWQKNCQQRDTGQNVAVLTTHISDYIFPAIISGIEETLTAQGTSLLLGSTQNDPERERQSLVQYLNSNIQGLIIEPTKSALGLKNQDLYQQFLDRKIPVITINAKTSLPKVPYFVMDDFGAGKLATKKLLDLGHQQLLGIFKTDDQQGIDRMNGFNRAIQETQTAIDIQLITYQTENVQTQMFERLSRILATKDARPTGIIAYNDQIAMTAYNLATKYDLKVPQDLSIVGFDNSLLSHSLGVQLVSAIHPQAQMGRDVAALMIKMIAEPTRNYAQFAKTYAPELSAGESVAAYQPKK
ncbi:GntR family transcriptional regulator [Lacticaseibacillus yichunensis]|uniref:GntR family transcriptional regulator n=1 Tax=Lacticaseibacillus yichunensis TaxID=2486015 RepID=A0ABW4CQM1_9LACO|nr:GntR family transcriptional regulator [Lacticaseibacillus yichunensis]